MEAIEKGAMIAKANIRNTVANLLGGSRFGGIGRYLASRAFGGYILAFHGSSGRSLTEQIDALYPDRAIPLDEMVSRIESGRSTSGLFSITVDDGYATVVEEYSQISRARQWPMTFFLPTSYLDKRSLPFLVIAQMQRVCPDTELELEGRRVSLADEVARKIFFAELVQNMYEQKEADYMPLVDGLIAHLVDNGLVSEDSIYAVEPPIPWATVRRLAREPMVSFQSHGVTHQAVASLSSDELRNELATSKSVIEEHTNSAVTHFCYPYGGPRSIGVEAPRVVSEVFRSAVTMTRGRLRGSDLFQLPRIPLYEPDTRNIARLKVLAR